MTTFDYFSAFSLIAISLFSLPVLLATYFKMDKWMWLTFLYFFVWGLYRMGWEDLGSSQHKTLALIFEIYGGTFFVECLLFGVALGFLEVPVSYKERLLAFIGKINTGLFFLLIPFTYHQVFWKGVIPNPSMNAVFTLFCLPFLRGRWFWIALIPIIYAKSASALLILSVYLFIYLYKKKRELLWLVIPAVLLFTTGIILSKKGLKNSTYERIVIWKTIMPLWLAKDPIREEHFPVPDPEIIVGMKKSLNHPWVGNGPNTFSIYGPVVQKSLGLYGPGYFDLWLFMHNDWLSLLFEFGVIGTLLVLISAIKVVWNVRNTTFVYPVAALFVSMLLYYPIHFPPHLVISFIVVSEGLRTKRAATIWEKSFS